MSTAQLSAPIDALTDLTLEAAVAARVLRTACAPAGLLQWLAGSVEVAVCDWELAAARGIPTAERRATLDRELTAALDEIVGPLSTRPAKSQQRQTRFASQWLAVACRYCAEQYTRLQLNIGPRLLAASLLPLYRCLATDDLREGLQQTQIRLIETLGLLALCDQVGPSLVEMLDTLSTGQESPHVILSTHCNLSLPHIAQLLGEITDEFDFNSGQFSTTASERLQEFDVSHSRLDMPAWAAPDLLWKLAGELALEKSELKLPRSWIGIPLPWNQIVDHWHKVLHLLGDQKILSVQLSDQTLSASAGCTDENLPSFGSILSPEQPSAVAEERAPVTVDEIADRGALQADVLISEIVTHNDPSFVNVIRRQIGKCRSEERAISLMSLIVLPENANHRFAVFDNGLSLWQRKLVDWLADHPQVVEPKVFLTGNGELLLCILDLERNEATALLRHGLIEVLTGQRFDDSQGNLLAEVDAPARYHAGIASTSSPGARFLPGQLIDPAIRCMNAARRHGKASIKSIEVY